MAQRIANSTDVRPPESDPEVEAMFMARALELAARGQGHVEPNPMVGCVIVRDGAVVGEGWHQRFGGPHAEVEALRSAGARGRGATAYVTLEPCCHQGKTPPCTEALIAAGVARVMCAQRDPFEAVNGGGIAALEAARVAVDVGLMEAEARRLNAPYLKLVATGRPWVIAKWAMTLDGKIATRIGQSRWISGEASRRAGIAHELRGRVDAIMVGRRTADVDDPLLTARPPGPRVAVRIVVDSQASLSLESQLVRTARDWPVLVAVGIGAAKDKIERLAAAGCDVICCADERAAQPRVSVNALLSELGRRRMTNVMVEGGAELLGSLLDAGAVDEVHVFIAPKMVGGRDAPGPVAGVGLEQLSSAMRLVDLETRHVGDDLYLHGRIAR